SEQRTEGRGRARASKVENDPGCVKTQRRHCNPHNLLGCCPCQGLHHLACALDEKLDGWTDRAIFQSHDSKRPRWHTTKSGSKGSPETCALAGGLLFATLVLGFADMMEAPPPCGSKRWSLDFVQLAISYALRHIGVGQINGPLARVLM